MIIVDTALERHIAAGNPPIRVGMIGAGFMASGVVLQTGGPFRDKIRIVAIANRTPQKADRRLRRRRLPRRGGGGQRPRPRPRHRGRPPRR